MAHITGTAGPDPLPGTSGADIVLGLDGNDTLYGEDNDGDATNDDNSADTFVFAKGTATDSGADTIADFEDGADKIDLTAFGLSGYGALVLGDGNNVVVTIEAGSTIMLTGMTKDDIDAADFIF